MENRLVLFLLVPIVTILTTTSMPENTIGKSDSNSDNNGKFAIFFDNPTPTNQAIIPHGVSQHKDSTDTTHLVGEVKNTGSTGIKFAQIIATIYEANNQTVGTGMTFTTTTDIPAGQSAPFDLILQPSDLTGAAAIKLHLDFREG